MAIVYLHIGLAMSLQKMVSIIFHSSKHIVVNHSDVTIKCAELCDDLFARQDGFVDHKTSVQSIRVQLEAAILSNCTLILCTEVLWPTNPSCRANKSSHNSAHQTVTSP